MKELKRMENKNIFENKVVSILIALFVCALWGSLFPFVKIGYSVFNIQADDISAIILFAGMRFVISGIIILSVLSIKETKITIPKKEYLWPISLVAITSIVLHYFFTYMALSMGEGSKSAIIKQVGFLFLSCFSFIFVKEDRFSAIKLAAGILGFLGIIVTNFESGVVKFAGSDILLIMASFCLVTSNVISKKIIKEVSPIQIVAYSQLWGGGFLCVIGISFGGEITHINIKSILIFAYICAASIIAYTLWNILIKYNDLSKLSVIKFTEPLFSVIFSGVLLGEDVFKVSYVIAFVIILAAILLSNTREVLTKRVKILRVGKEK